ncbi:MAG: peptidoglycan DD-metalloendopeptidase family protein [Synergistaceae bacterium]|nr:peptidoglycan DD-metalloendopeptidase family protein [Synergistaceae bacterium]
MKKILMAVIFMLVVSCAAHAAAKWETMTFTDDLTQDFSTLTEYCRAREIAVKDVFWANHTDAEDIKPGSTIYLPARQADLLAIWQNIGAWQPKSLVPVTSGAAARRLIEQEQPVTQPAPVQVTEQADANILPAPEKLLPQKAQLPAQVQTAPVQAETQPEIQTAPVQAKTPVKISAPAPIPIPTPAAQARTQQAAKQARPSPASAIAQMAKPDKILTAKPKPPKQELAGLMDPIIILSPNGDPTQGPMRLVISGDKVEVVKLPQSAAPKKPTVADATAPFTSSYSYLPYYNVTPKAGNNNIMTNLNALNGKMMWPVDGKISSPFGKWRGKHRHEGIDIPMPHGTPIRAARNGVVARTGNNSTMGFRGYGNFVMLDHGGNVKTFYAHCSKVAVREGQKVMQGEIIGYVGSTGRSTANHLHFEVRINDAKVNPVPYLGGNAQLASRK